MDSQPTANRATVGVDRPIALHPPGMSSHHYRFADFDEDSFSEHAEVSAEQAKRALRAHLAETERRMTEAGRLGTALVQQQKELSEKLREVEQLEAESELSPELKKKLSELEREYDDVARETARAFLPKQRIPSNESAGSPEVKGGRRSLSPVKYETHASGSPSKLTVSNRKQRNQPSNRVHDIEFATEISTSLISQVRGLQSLLAEREEELRDAKQDLETLEDTTESLRERVKELDESEHRYKEENWNLEGRIHDLEAAQRDASDKDKKVAVQLAALLAEKNKTQRELDELRGTHSRLVDDHAAAVKHHDIELGTAKRSMALFDTEKLSLQKKIDELVGQNQEFARAVSMQHRTRTIDSDAFLSPSDEDFETAGDHATPEHSPPASPVKGTPRHSVLESETLKTSLLHSQRTVQSLRTTLHREKTEKLELRRLLQDTRDDLERMRADPNVSVGAASKKNRNVRESQKLRASQLGAVRAGRTDFYNLGSADPDWEEVQGELSPSAVRARAGYAESSEHFDTANEAQSDTSYATANDGAETTDNFLTGAEQLSSSDDTMTETESGPTPRRRVLISRGSSTSSAAAAAAAAAAVQTAEHEYEIANQSTASLSDEDEYHEYHDSPKTPTSTLPSTGGLARMRLRVSRGSLATRRLRQATGEDVGSSPASRSLQSSPFSAADSPATVTLANSSTNSTPRKQGQQQSLFAELGEMDEESDEDGSIEGTPSRSIEGTPLRQTTSASQETTTGLAAVSSVSSEKTRDVSFVSPASPLVRSGSPEKIVTVDRGTLTEAVIITPWSDDDEKLQKHLTVSDLSDSRPLSFLSDSTNGAGDVDIHEKLKQFPSPPTSTPSHLPIIAPIPFPYSSGDEATTTTREARGIPEPTPEFTVSDIISILVEPVSEPATPKPLPAPLTLSPVTVEYVRPKTPEQPAPVEKPTFSTSTLHAVNITPVASPEPKKHTPLPLPVPVPIPLPKKQPTFSVSAIQQEHIQPKPEPATTPVKLSFTGLLHTQQVEPVQEPETPPPAFSLSSVQHQQVEPVATPEKPLPVFSLSNVQREIVEPVATPAKPAPVFSLSNVQREHVEPVATPAKAAPVFSLSDVQREQVEPVATPAKAAPVFALSNVQREQVEPVATPAKAAPVFSLSNVEHQQVQPVAPVFALSNVQREVVEPVATPAKTAPAFSLSHVQREQVEPVASPTKDAPIFSLSNVQRQQVEPAAPVFSLSNVQREQVAPVATPEKAVPPPPAFSLSNVQREEVTPVATPKTVVPPPQFSLSNVQREQVEPVAAPEKVVPPPQFSLSSVQRQAVEPVAIPEKVVPVPELSFSNVQREQVAPVAVPEKVVPTPVFSLSTLQHEHVAPVAAPEKPLPPMTFSGVVAQDVQPVKEEVHVPVAVKDEGVSAGTQTDEWQPEPKTSGASVAEVGAASAFGAAATAAISRALGNRSDSTMAQDGSRSPKRNAFILPRDIEGLQPLDATSPAFANLSKSKEPASPVIAEDETRQSPSVSPVIGANGPESPQPFKEISANAKHAAAPSAYVEDEEAGDDSFDVTPRAVNKTTIVTAPATMEDGRTSYPGSPTKHARSESQDSTASSVRRGRVTDIARAEMGAVGLTGLQRAGSGASARSHHSSALPPLPANHREAIEAARSGSSGASWRVRTPPSAAARWSNNRAGPTSAAASELRPASRPETSRTNGSNAGGSVVSVVSVVPAAPGTISRQTSLSSFASEVDARFHMHDGGDVFGGRHTDPRMILAITQTMIGEYLWKYTRKPGRSGMSENRHRRYFWIHPYTRMLFWSDQGPTQGTRAEHRAKSVIIEGVRVVADDNPMPPGLHRKSLVVISPGRTIKFTCTTSHRHEIWFNALSYLLLRNEETTDDDAMMANGDQITAEDVAEFNPSFGGQRSGAGAGAGAGATGTGGGSTVRRKPPAMSLSSYNSRTTRTESPAFDVSSMTVPTLTPTPKRNVADSTAATPSRGTSAAGPGAAVGAAIGAAATAAAAGGAGTASATGTATGTSRSRLSRIGGYWRSNQSLSAQFGSLRGRGSTIGRRHTGGPGSSIYEASEVEVNDSAEDLREMYEAQDRDADRLENVRACCDGKHDVGTLSRSSRRHRHSAMPSSALSTPTHNNTTVRHRP